MNFLPLQPNPDDWQRAVQQAAQVLAAGGIVAYPSETVWGLAAQADQAQAVARLYALKGRDAGKPVQVSCLNAEVALSLAQPSGALKALTGLWPGPLTIVTPARLDCPEWLAPGGLVGLRVPDHRVAQALLAACGGLLATTSCNPSGQAPALNEPQARSMKLAELVLPDAGIPARGLASTVVELPEGRILRQGEVAASVIQARLFGPDFRSVARD